MSQKNMENVYFDTIYDVLRFRAESQSDSTAYVFLENGEDEQRPLTFKKLYDSSREFAEALRSHDMAGERALLIFESDYNYIVSFFACICAGVISVPLHPPGKNKSLARISAIAGDSGAKLILSTRSIYNQLIHSAENDDILKSLSWVLIDDLHGDPMTEWTPPVLNRNSVAYLQYTSGSTGIPKGVIVSHQNLLTNLSIIDKSHGHNESSVMVTWLPIHHDMGLIYGMLLPFFCGYPCYFMTPQAFVQKPFRWLHAITKFKGTHNAAPNFAFELCVNKISDQEKNMLDLSSWTVAMNAAEPVRAETLKRFSEYFAGCGFKPEYFKPGYGLAEGTLILSTTFRNDLPVMRRFDDTQLEKNNIAVDANPADNESKIHVGHSCSIEDTKIAIVDPNTKIECSEGHVGEVWAKGKSIAGGYWKRDDATEETFHAHIADTGEGPFLRTGDLGFIKDNELYITGRHKDIIIIRGQNHYPQDIEYTVEASHPSLRLGCVAAFPLTDDNGEENIGIVQEVQKNHEDDLKPEEVFKAIVTAVSEEHELEVSSITLIKAQTIPKTSSGKIQRRACREGFLNNSLSTVAQWNRGEHKTTKELVAAKENKPVANTNELREFLIKRLSAMLEINSDEIDPNETFSSFGLDSLKAVQISGELEEFLKCQLPSTLVYDYPSINSLSRFLSGKLDSGSRVITKQHKQEKEPVAIVGIGLRFPGGNNDPESFYNFLMKGGDAIRTIPEGRWKEIQLKHNTVRLGGFVDNVEDFDPVFFGISPREALQMDPQQRIALEVAWEALEDACIDPSSLAGKNAGVFMGVCSYDYSRFSAGRKELFDVYTGTGTSLSIVANRISYLLDFRGPSLAIDTACSSSLVALHTACRSLNSGESSVAIAGGVNLLLNPDWNVVFTEADMLAPDGHCKTFDASADGYVRSEGCGIVILKRLSDAVNDRDRVYAVINGSAINQDGKSNGITAPNGPSQVDVIRRALEDSGVSTDDIGYIEAHGTGTPLGDPIEVNSIVEALSLKKRGAKPPVIGSVKTNIGHLEAAAGVAGVIKTALGFYYGSIPGQINFSRVNPEIDIADGCAEIAVGQVPIDERVRYAGISSFGFGGTNAHVVMSAVGRREAATDGPERPSMVFTFSTKNENALKELAGNYADHFGNSICDLESICYSANAGKESMPYRAAFVVNDSQQLLNCLHEFSGSNIGNEVFTGHVKPGKVPKVAFLFPGQGAQYTGMAKELYDTVPSFRDDVNKCNEILKNYLPISLLEVLYDDSSALSDALDKTRYTQPALFSVEYSLGKLWMSWGIVPSVMMGHSAGELVAACLAGVFSLEDGLKLAAERGRLMEELTSEGEMYTVFADEVTTARFLEGYGGSVSVASKNSPIKTVISGDKLAIREILGKIDKEQIEYKKINVSIASHSPLMESMISEFRKICESIVYNEAHIPVISNITAELTTDLISNPEYWCRHILSPVEFSKSIKVCVENGCTYFVDLGPKPTSIGIAQETSMDQGLVWIPSFRKNFTAWQTLNEGISRLFVGGAHVNWRGFYAELSGSKVSLPHYPFQRQRYWIADKVQENKSNFTEGSYSSNVLLGSRLNTSSARHKIFNSQLRADDPAFLQGHRVFEQIVLPGAAYVDMIASAVSASAPGQKIKLTSVKFHSPLFVSETEYAAVQTVVIFNGKNTGDVEIFSRAGSSTNELWQLHASAEFRLLTSESKILCNKAADLTGKVINATAFYSEARKCGIDYSQLFERIENVRENDGKILAEASLPENESSSGFTVHPALLDMSFQVALAAIYRNRRGVFVPSEIREVSVYKNPLNKVSIVVEHRHPGSSATENFDIKIFDAKGELCILIRKFKLAEVSSEVFLGIPDKLKDLFFETGWRSSPEKNVRSVSFDPAKLKLSLSNRHRVVKSAADVKLLTAYLNDLQHVERLASWYILHFLKSSLNTLSHTEEYSISDIAASSRVIEKYHRLFLRLIEHLEGMGLAQIRDGKFILNPEAFQLIDSTPLSPAKESLAEYEFVKVCGENLRSVLTGTVDALDVLFPDGDFSKAARIYRESPAFETMNGILASIVKIASSTVHPERKLRILELGAGTGSTTAAVTELLRSSRTEYTFTDISSAFFDDARLCFAGKDYVEFCTLDIEKDPVEQGFEKESYDIILASNVIHATKDLKASLANIKQLLRKGGLLLLNEASEKKGWIDITFGMTDGWWRFEDSKIRKDHPLLGPSAWTGLMDMAGYEELSMFTTVDSNGKQLSGQHVIAAFRPVAEEVAKHPVVLYISDAEIDSAVREELSMLDPRTLFAFNHSEYKELEPDHFCIPLSSAEDVARLFDEEILAGAGSLKIVFSAINSSVKKSADPQAESMYYCASLLNIIKRLQSCGIDSELKIITRNAIAVSEKDKVNGLSASVLWGFAKVISIEHPELKVCLADIDSDNSFITASYELLREEMEDQLAFRNGKKLIQRITPARLTSSNKFSPKKNFAYLITGGFGGIGLLSARVLADMGARNIILAGRRGTSPEAESLKAELSKRKVNLIFATVDVTSENSVKELFEMIGEENLKVKGIIHSAGILSDAVISNQDMNKFATVMSPKVKSAWLLYNMTRNSGLQFFIMYSSVASVLGSAGQANHSSANAFLDSLSHYLHSRGLNAMSINWGVWSEIGSAVEKGADKLEKIPGLLSITPEEGMKSLRKAIDSKLPQLGIYRIDWEKYNSNMGRSLTSDLTFSSQKTGDETRAASAKAGLAEKLLQSVESDQIIYLQDYFRSLISSIMGLDPEDIEPDIPLSSMGLDSLMAIELKNRVNKELGVNLNLVRYMEDTDIIQLSEELRGQIPEMLASKQREEAVVQEARTATEGDKARDLLAEIENLSEEELDKLLREMD